MDACRFSVLAALLGLTLAGPVGATEPQSCAVQKREVVDLRRMLEKRESTVRTLSVRLRKLARGNIRAVEKALAGTGLTVDGLIRKGGGQGGPFIPAESPHHPDVERWESLSRAVRVLPLAAPLSDFTVTSGFGPRRDPVNKRRARHEGVDLKAPLRSPVAATAPGKVVFAGRKGGYGRLVEVDHGLGVHTRYGHLAAINVRLGQKVAGGQRIGLLGSSGRSTGPHLHYEVLVDQQPRNPSRFLKAGKNLSLSR